MKHYMKIVTALALFAFSFGWFVPLMVSQNNTIDAAVGVAYAFLIAIPLIWLLIREYVKSLYKYLTSEVNVNVEKTDSKPSRPDFPYGV